MTEKEKDQICRWWYNHELTGFRKTFSGKTYPSTADMQVFRMFIDSMQEEPVILTEEILKKNGFLLNPRPIYKDPYWSKLFTASDGRDYCFIIYMEQIIEHLMKVEPLATLDGRGHPTCYLPHPKTVQQLQDSLRLFGINDIISV